MIHRPITTTKVVIPESAQRLSGTQGRLHGFRPVPWVPDNPCGASGMTTVLDALGLQP